MTTNRFPFPTSKSFSISLLLSPLLSFFLVLAQPAWCDAYDVLGVRRTATLAEIRVVYLDLVNRHHPDHGGDTTRVAEIIEAYRWIEKNHFNESTQSSPPPRTESQRLLGGAKNEQGERGSRDVNARIPLWDLPSLKWQPGGWRKGHISVGMAHDAGLTEPSRTLGPLPSYLVQGALILSDEYESTLRPDFRVVAMDAGLPFLYRALYVFDAATLFHPPEPGQESEWMANLLLSLRKFERSGANGGEMLPEGQFSYSELFMAGFAIRKSHTYKSPGENTDRHPLFWRIQDDGFRNRYGVIETEVSEIFRRGRAFSTSPFRYWLKYRTDGSFEILKEKRRVDRVGHKYEDAYVTHFFWQVARGDLAVWENFIENKLGLFLAASLYETNGRNFLEWLYVQSNLRQAIAIGKDGGHRGLRALLHRTKHQCSVLLGSRSVAEPENSLSFDSSAAPALPRPSLRLPSRSGESGGK